MPLYADGTFKAELLEHLKYEINAKRARGAQDNAYSLATTKYYEPLLQRANTALKTLRTASPLRIRPALQKVRRRELLAALGARLEFYAWQYHVALAVGNNNVLPNPTQTQIDNLCGTAVPPGPDFLARHAVTTITTQFINYLTDVVTHVDADWADIKNVFFPQWNLNRLMKLGASGSDSHKGGKSVVILTFEGKSPPPVPVPVTTGDRAANFFTISTVRKLRLVYKPADLTLDFLMVADTVNVRAQVGGLPNPPGGSLLENLNTLVTGGALAVDPAFAARPPLWLPIYSILPRNGGVLATAYGYIEYLDHGPEATPTTPQNATTFSVTLRDRDRMHWDWITEDNNDLIDFYRLFGWYCAIGLNFGLADAHNQNVMVHNKKPHLIDLEISFKWICDALDKTGLQDVMASPGPAKHGDWCHIFYRNGGVLSRTTGAQAAHYINCAITEAFALILADPGGVLRAWLTDPSLTGAIARYTPRKTSDYGSFLRDVYGAGQLPVGGIANLSPVPGGLVPFLPNFPQIGDLRTWYQQNADNHRPNFAIVDPLHDYQCYLNCDYPCYYRVLNSMDLLNARGVAVVVTQPVIAWNSPQINNGHPKTIAGAHYFDSQPALFLFEIADWTLLAGPANTWVHLTANIVADLTPHLAAAVPAVVLTGAAVGTEEKVDQHWRIIDGPRIFHFRRVKVGLNLTNRVEGYETGTAAAMVLRQFDRFQNDAAFRGRLLADAQAYINGKYPPAAVVPAPVPPPPPIYNGF